MKAKAMKGMDTGPLLAQHHGKALTSGFHLYCKWKHSWTEDYLVCKPKKFVADDNLTVLTHGTYGRMSHYLLIFIQLPQIRLYVSYHAVLNLPTQLLRPVGECIMAEESRPVSEVTRMRLKSGSEKRQAGALGSMVRLRTVSIGREKHSMCGHCCKKNAHVWAFLQEVEVPFGVRILGSFLCSVEQSLWVHAVATNGCQQMSFTPWKKSVSSIIQPFDWTAKASINATLFMNKIVYLQNESNWLACRRQALYFQSSFR